MIKVSCLFALFACLAFNADAQQTQSAVNVQDLKPLLNIADSSFNQLKYRLALFNDSIFSVMNNQALNSENKKLSIAVIHTNRKNYLQQVLPPNKYIVFTEFEKSIRDSSSYRKYLKEKVNK